MNNLYRCGYCGYPTDKDGKELDQKSYEIAMGMIDNKQDCELVHGYCCINEIMRHEMVQVTREMAMDAGYPEMEGEWINW